MDKKENVYCDFETGVCGPTDSDQNNGIINFVDLSANQDENQDEDEKNKD